MPHFYTHFLISFGENGIVYLGAVNKHEIFVKFKNAQTLTCGSLSLINLDYGYETTSFLEP